jgi:hypothetical protein
VRLMQGVRLVWGGLLLVAPGIALEAITGRPATRSQERLLRVLGARHLLQGGVDLVRPTRGLLRAGVAVDLLHAATCAGAVALSPEWRRAALIDGTGAVGFAAGGLARARPGPFRYGGGGGA